MIPQEAVLIEGTVRYNLDPFDKSSTEVRRSNAALARCCEHNALAGAGAGGRVEQDGAEHGNAESRSWDGRWELVCGRASSKCTTRAAALPGGRMKLPMCFCAVAGDRSCASPQGLPNLCHGTAGNALVVFAPCADSELALRRTSRRRTSTRRRMRRFNASSGGSSRAPPC
jgi:hypothetical protein